MITHESTFAFIGQSTLFDIPAAEMHFCSRPKEDPGNLETGCELDESKDLAFIARGGTDHRKVASMDTFRTPDTAVPFRDVKQSVDAVDGPKDGNKTLFGVNFLIHFFRKLILQSCPSRVMWRGRIEPYLIASDHSLETSSLFFFKNLEKGTRISDAFALLVRRSGMRDPTN
jgi:hypothetical protein